MTTFPELLSARLRAGAAQPLITFLDDSTGERTELSATTFENWVAKTANLFVDELMLDPGEVVSIDLPTHWLVPVFLGAAWSCGLEARAEAPHASLRIIGPDPRAPGGEADQAITMACALHPFATRYLDPLPPETLDHGALWPGQSDVFIATNATDLGDIEASADRVLTDLDLRTPAGRALLLSTVAGSGALVLVGTSEESRWPVHFESERATLTLRSNQPIS